MPNSSYNSNLFLLLELPLDKPWDQAMFEYRLMEKRAEWSGDLNNPKKRARASRNLEQLDALKGVARDRTKREAAAAEARIIIAQARQAFEVDLRLFEKKGVMSEDEFERLVKKHNSPFLSEANMRQAIRVPVAPLLETATVMIIENLLDNLKKRDLYDFLGLLPGERQLVLLQRARDRYDAVQRKAKKSPNDTVISELAGYCLDIFKTEAGRQKYNDTARYRRLQQLQEQIVFYSDQSHSISVAIWNKLLTEAQKSGLTKGEVEQEIRRYAGVKGYTIQEKQTDQAGARQSRSAIPYSPEPSYSLGSRLPVKALVATVAVVVSLLAIGFSISSLPAIFPLLNPTIPITVDATPPTIPPVGTLLFAAYEEERLAAQVRHAGSLTTASLYAPAWSPLWSPDGRQIAFVSDQFGEPQLYLMDDAGDNLFRLTNIPGEKSSLAWSPDGGQIAFVSDGLLHTVHVPGVEWQALTEVETGAVTHTAWSPDGQSLLLAIEADSERRVYRLDIDGDLHTLTNFDSWRPAWSPDGAAVAISAERGIHLLDRDGRNLRRVTSFRAWQPEWSPDGRYIAFLSDQGNDNLNPELWIMNSNGYNLVRLTSSSAWDYIWSPDSQWLAYITGEPDRNLLQLWLIHLESKTEFYVANVNQLHISWAR